MLCQFDKLLYPKTADASTIEYIERYGRTAPKVAERNKNRCMPFVIKLAQHR